MFITAFTTALFHNPNGYTLRSIPLRSIKRTVFICGLRTIFSDIKKFLFAPTYALVPPQKVVCFALCISMYKIRLNFVMIISEANVKVCASFISVSEMTYLNPYGPTFVFLSSHLQGFQITKLRTCLHTREGRDYFRVYAGPT
jgi:hypothetical protein